jgi:WD40 repeat protein
VYLLNLKTRRVECFASRGSAGTTPLFIDGRYVYTAGNMWANLFRYNIRQRRLEDLGLGPAIKKEMNSLDDWVWCVDKSPDGTLFFGTDCDFKLFSFRPAGGALRCRGPAYRLDEYKGCKYMRALCAGFAGKVYCGLGTRARLTVFDPKKDAWKQILPEKYMGGTWVTRVARAGKRLLVFTDGAAGFLVFDPVSDRFIGEVSVPGAPQLSLLKTDPVKGTACLWSGKAVYTYDPESGKVGEYASVDHPHAGTAIGITRDNLLVTRNGFETFYVFDLNTGKAVDSVPAAFQGNGMIIQTMASDGKGGLYGGTFINQHLFHYDRASDACTDLGISAPFGGQSNSMVYHDGILYSGVYGGAWLSRYDTRRPFKPSYDGNASNPRLMAQIGEEQNRVWAMLRHENGKIYMGSVPNYGKLGGAISVYDPETGKIEVFRNLVKDQSVCRLLKRGDGTLLAGTTAFGGHIEAQGDVSAHIFIWDPKTKKTVKDIVPVPGATYVRALAGNGKQAFGAVSAADIKKEEARAAAVTFFVYDFAADKVVFRADPGFGLIEDLCLFEGLVYGVGPKCLFRFHPKTRKFETLVPLKGDLDLTDFVVPGDGRNLFFTRLEKVYELRIE